MIYLTDENQTKAENLGIIEIILNVIKIHISIVQVCESGCKALKALSANSK